MTSRVLPMFQLKSPDWFASYRVKPNHKDLLAWRKARQLVVSVYQLTSTFPETERYVMVSQMRRAALSVISNISEGAARGSSREFARFLLIARGSLSELDTQLVVAMDLGFIDCRSDVVEQVRLVSKLVNGLITTIRRNRASYPADH